MKKKHNESKKKHVLLIQNLRGRHPSQAYFSHAFNTDAGRGGEGWTLPPDSATADTASLSAHSRRSCCFWARQGREEGGWAGVKTVVN